ncbi:MAG: hypothetical protein GY845_25620 [Planctomycetes bacterium]|nr:hypothetical protein [Planctomycetota bacterium]
MSFGEDTAKDVVLGRAKELTNKAVAISTAIQNGDAENTQVQGKRLEYLVESQSLIISMLAPLYKAEFVTKQDCEERHKEKEKPLSKIKIGPVEYQGSISNIMLVVICMLVPSMIMIYMLGKINKWW